MNFNFSKHFSKTVLILILILIGSVISNNIVGQGVSILEKYSDKCEDCNEKNVHLSLGALNSQIDAMKSKIDAVEGRIGANEAKLQQINYAVTQNTAYINKTKKSMADVSNKIALSK